MWKIDDPQMAEAAKVRFDLVPYMRGRVLDFGCGNDKVYPLAVGVDNKIDAKLFGIEVKPDIAVETCERLPIFGDECADTIFSSHLLEHIANYEGALIEWWRILRPSGHLILYLPNNEDSVENGGYPKMGEKGANPDHKVDITYDKIVTAMQGVGSWDLVEFQRRKEDREYSLLFIFKKLRNEDEGKCPCCGSKIARHHYTYRHEKPKHKTLGIVRLGAFGDALWITGLLPYWKEQGYHITVYTQPQGEEVLRHDPNIDRIICQPLGLFDFGDNRVAMWQTAYWLHEEKKYDKFINLIGSTERRLLPQPFEADFYLPDEQRRRLMNKNYVEELHKWADVPFGKHFQKFTPTPDELAWAASERAKIPGRLVLINPAGSSLPKWWPYTQPLADKLADEGVYTRIVGDIRFNKFRESKHVKVIGTDWSIRKVFTFAQMADAVVGVESAIINSVAFEDVLKIVLLSHSTHENLTRDWIKAIAVEPYGLKCYPCHRIHTDMAHCTYIKETDSAACKAAASAELVFEHLMKYLNELPETV